MGPALPHPVWPLLASIATLGAGIPLALGMFPEFPGAVGVATSIVIAALALLALTWASSGSPARSPLIAFLAAVLVTASGVRLVLSLSLIIASPDGYGPIGLFALATLAAFAVVLGLFASVRAREAAWMSAEGTGRRLLPQSAHGALEAATYAAAVTYAAGALPTAGAWPYLLGDEAAARATGLAGILALDAAVLAALAALLLLLVPIREAGFRGSVIHGIPRMRRAVAWGIQALTLSALLIVASVVVSLARGDGGLVLPLAMGVAVALALYSAIRGLGGIPKLTPMPAMTEGVVETVSCPSCEAILAVSAKERPLRYACPTCGTGGFLYEA